MSNHIVIESNRQQNLISLNSLRANLETLPDPRKAKGKRYQLADLLILLILAKLGG